MTLQQILIFLSGKKSVIATIIMGFVSYFAAKGYIGEYEVTLITVIVGAVCGTASYATGKYIYGK